MDELSLIQIKTRAFISIDELAIQPPVIFIKKADNRPRMEHLSTHASRASLAVSLLPGTLPQIRITP